MTQKEYDEPNTCSECGKELNETNMWSEDTCLECAIALKLEPETEKAIELNIRTLLKMHPNPQQFIKTLQNEAIDQAFRELSETIQNHTKRLHEIEKILEDANLWSFE